MGSEVRQRRARRCHSGAPLTREDVLPEGRRCRRLRQSRDSRFTAPAGPKRTIAPLAGIAPNVALQHGADELRTGPRVIGETSARVLAAVNGTVPTRNETLRRLIEGEQLIEQSPGTWSRRQVDGGDHRAILTNVWNVRSTTVVKESVDLPGGFASGRRTRIWISCGRR